MAAPTLESCWEPCYYREVVRDYLQPELVLLASPLLRVERVVEPPLDCRYGRLREASSMVPLLVEFLAPPPHHKHLPPGLRTLGSDSDDVPLDGDVRPAAVSCDEVAYLPRQPDSL